ncbi:MAG: serine/threonine protein kinase [Burkholderiales bacterium]
MDERRPKREYERLDAARRKRIHDAIGKRGFYATELLAIDERCALFRARRARAPVLVKVALGQPPHAEDLADLARECAILDGLAIDAISRVIEFIVDEQCPILVLEDPGDVTLEALLAKDPPPLDRVLDYAIQLVAILGPLHRKGLIHRGIRPHVVLARPDQGRVVLMDFSDAARNATEASASLFARAYGTRLPYIAPEQTGRLNRAADYRSDFYALGVLLYELLCGHPPFVSDDPLEVVHGQIAKIPQAPCDVNPAVPVMVSQLVMKLLAKTAEDRYQSATGLRDLENRSP